MYRLWIFYLLWTKSLASFRPCVAMKRSSILIPNDIVISDLFVKGFISTDIVHTSFG
jgi:hypothetical protein